MSSCSQLLCDDLMLGPKSLRRTTPRILTDGFNVDTSGWNFAQHRDNADILQRTESTLLAAIERPEQLYLIFLIESSWSSSRLAWRENAMASYEDTVQEILKRLGVIVHVCGGQPVRESEFFSMTYRSTQRPRSVTLRFDRAMIHVQYQKANNREAATRKMFDSLPTRLPTYYSTTLSMFCHYVKGIYDNWTATSGWVCTRQSCGKAFGDSRRF